MEEITAEEILKGYENSEPNMAQDYDDNGKALEKVESDGEEA